MLDKLERDAIFKFTRLFSFSIIIVLCVGIVSSLLFFINLRSSTQVSLLELKLNEKKKGNATNVEGLKEAASIPYIVEKYLSDVPNQKVLFSWLSNLNLDQQVDFLSNLSAVIQEAEQNTSTGQNMNDIINEYKDAKLARLSKGVFEEYAQQARQAAAIFFIAIFLSMIALFSLVLVLLAIERNTRLNQTV